MKEVVIVSAIRTPIGSFMGSLSIVPAPQLGAIAIKEALARINLGPELVDEVLMGNVLSTGTGQAPAKQASLLAGIPPEVPCTTINKVCASGMKAVMQAAQSIALGDASIIVAGGMENMSLVPHHAYLRLGSKFGSNIMVDGLQKDGLTDAYDHVSMGEFADACAIKYAIYRAKQDAFAIQSYTRAEAAWSSGSFDNEIVGVTVEQRRGAPLTIATDEEYKNVFLDKVSNLKPAFTKNGTVTAANASTINDGAAALVLMSIEKAAELNLKPLAKIMSYADASQEPKYFTTSPAKAIPKALKKAKLSLKEVDFFEINEAFSVVSLANMQLLGLNDSKVNVNGGAVSLGHPLDCSGARILVTLLNILQSKEATIGVAAICNGGGGASAMVLEKI